MSRIDDILVRVRDSLADAGKQRWSDERLIRLIDEAQKDIARHSKLLKGQAEFSLSVGEAFYALPDDLWLLQRATFNDCEIPLTSYDQLDEQGRKEVVNDRDYNAFERHRGYNVNYGDNYGRVCWELTTASRIEYLVYDNRDLSEIRVYPIPDENIAESTYTFQNAGFLDPVIYEANSPYGVLTDVPDADQLIEELGVTVDADSILFLITDPEGCNGVTLVDDVTFDSPFGLIGEIEDLVKDVGFHGDEQLGVVVGIDDYTLDSVFGVTTDLFDPEIDDEEFKSVFGVVTGVNESVAVIRIWYIRLPKVISLATDTLEIHSMFDTAIRYFVVGNAYLDDNDAAYRQKGTETLQMYERELDLAKTTSSRDGVSSPTNYRTSYRGPFE